VCFFICRRRIFCYIWRVFHTWLLSVFHNETSLFAIKLWSILYNSVICISYPDNSFGKNKMNCTCFAIIMPYNNIFSVNFFSIMRKSTFDNCCVVVWHENTVLGWGFLSCHFNWIIMLNHNSLQNFWMFNYTHICHIIADNDAVNKAHIF